MNRDVQLIAERYTNIYSDSNTTQPPSNLNGTYEIYALSRFYGDAQDLNERRVYNGYGYDEFVNKCRSILSDNISYNISEDGGSIEEELMTLNDVINSNALSDKLIKYLRQSKAKWYKAGVDYDDIIIFMYDEYFGVYSTDKILLKNIIEVELISN